MIKINQAGSRVFVTPRIQLSIFITPTLAIFGYVIYHFLRGRVFVFCFAVCSCLAFHIIAISALHPHVFIKPRSRSYVTASLFVFIDLLSDRLSLLTFSQTNWTPLFSLSPRPTKPPLSPWPFVRPHCLCFPLSSKCPPSLHSRRPPLVRVRNLPGTRPAQSSPLDPDHRQTSINYLHFLIWTSEAYFISTIRFRSDDPNSSPFSYI